MGSSCWEYKYALVFMQSTDPVEWRLFHFSSVPRHTKPFYHHKNAPTCPKKLIRTKPILLVFTIKSQAESTAVVMALHSIPAGLKAMRPKFHYRPSSLQFQCKNQSTRTASLHCNLACLLHSKLLNHHLELCIMHRG